MLFTGAFQLAWSPFSLSIQHEEDSKKVYANVLTYYLVIMCGIGIGLSIFSLEILKIFTTKLYYGASIIVPYLVFSVMSSGVYYIVSIGVNITKKTSHIGWTTMVSAGASIALNFILIPRYGIVGASISSCISTWLSPILLYFVSQHYYPIKYKLGKAAIILSSSIILIIIGNFIKIPNLLLAITLKFTLLIAYFLILMATSIIQPSMLLRILKGLVNRKG
jgi:O-antigen/teichoic acid export membrane protein